MVNGMLVADCLKIASTRARSTLHRRYSSKKSLAIIGIVYHRALGKQDVADQCPRGHVDHRKVVFSDKP